MSRSGRAWRDLRQVILSRDDHTCQFCLAADTRLDIHHITPSREGGHDAPDNLITLCSYCHARISRPHLYGLPVAMLVNYLAALACLWSEKALPAISDVALGIHGDGLYQNEAGALCIAGEGLVEPQAELLCQIAQWRNGG